MSKSGAKNRLAWSIVIRPLRDAASIVLGTSTMNSTAPSSATSIASRGSAMSPERRSAETTTWSNPPIEHGVKELLLAREPAVHRRDPKSRSGSDVVHRRVRSGAGEDLFRRPHDPGHVAHRIETNAVR